VPVSAVEVVLSIAAVESIVPETAVERIIGFATEDQVFLSGSEEALTAIPFAYRHTRDVGNGDSDRLRVDAAVTIRDLHGHVVYIVGSSISRALEVGSCEEGQRTRSINPEVCGIRPSDNRIAQRLNRVWVSRCDCGHCRAVLRN